MTVSLLDATSGPHLMLYNQRITTTWQRYKVVCAGIPAGHVPDVVFYPGGSYQTTRQIDITGVQVSDFD